MVTGSLQVKGLVYYIVLNVYPNNKRNQKWIPTTVIANGKKVNQIKAEKLLSDILMIYDKDSYIDNKKTAEQLLEDNELKRIRLHDLRHSCATLLVQNKVSIKDIQIWLGHSNIQTTMIYTHMDETNKKVSAQVLVAKFQYILTNYNEKEIYEMENQTLNNLYEDIESLNQIKNVVVTA